MSQSGTLPVNWLFANLKLEDWVKFEKEEGIEPVRLVLDKLNKMSFERLPIHDKVDNIWPLKPL